MVVYLICYVYELFYRLEVQRLTVTTYDSTVLWRAFAKFFRFDVVLATQLQSPSHDPLSTWGSNRPTMSLMRSGHSVLWLMSGVSLTGWPDSHESIKKTWNKNTSGEVDIRYFRFLVVSLVSLKIDFLRIYYMRSGRCLFGLASKESRQTHHETTVGCARSWKRNTKKTRKRGISMPTRRQQSHPWSTLIIISLKATSSYRILE